MKNYSTENLVKRKMYFEADSIGGYYQVWKLDNEYIIQVYYNTGDSKFYFTVMRLTSDGVFQGSSTTYNTGGEKGSNSFTITPLTSTKAIFTYFSPDNVSGNSFIGSCVITITPSTLSCSLGSMSTYALSPTGAEVTGYASNISSQLISVAENPDRAIIAYIKKYTSGSDYYSLETCVISVDGTSITYGSVNTYLDNTTGKLNPKIVYINGTNHFIISYNSSTTLHLVGYTNVTTTITKQDNTMVSNASNNLSIIDLNDEISFGFSYRNQGTTKSGIIIGSFDGTTITAGADPVEVDTAGSGYICSISDKSFVWVYEDDTNDVYAEFCFANTDQMTTKRLISTNITATLPYVMNTYMGKMFLFQNIGTLNNPYTFVIGSDGQQSSSTTFLKLLST